MAMSDAAGVALRFVTGGDTVGQTAALVSTASVGGSFGPGLLPRSPRDQAVVTGLVTASQYGLVVTTQSMLAAFVRSVVPSSSRTWGPTARLAVHVGSDALFAATGLAIERMLPPRPDEAIRRAFVRTTGRRMARVGLAGVAVAAVAAADEATAREGFRPLRALAPIGGLAIGSALAAYQIRRFREGAEERTRPVDPLTMEEQATPEPLPALPLPPVARSIAIGTAVSAGLQGLAFVEGLFVRGSTAAVRRLSPGAGALAPVVGHVVAVGALAAGVVAGIEYVNRRAESGGSAIDAAYTAAPRSTTVSGGPVSGVEWTSLSREGVRFVNMALSEQEIAQVTGVPVDQVAAPVRAFAGLASAPTVDERVDLVMEELERLGAFERSVICVASPTGSGYVNYVAIETLEYLTRGDCATVALQYSLRPSFLSLDRVAMGREQNRALFHALAWRLRAIPEDQRPRVVGLGESLGAHTMQDAFLHEGVAGFHRAGIERALFLGTPAGSKWAKQWRLAADRTDRDHEAVEVASYAEWMAIPPDRRAAHRFVLLSHHEDPITRFEPALAVQQPSWLGPVDERPPRIPQAATWLPLTTFMLTLVDTKNAMDVTPGTFVAYGHDYRADLARMVSEAYALPVGDEELLSIERALRERERAWAERRLLAEQLQRAREAVKREVASWDIKAGVPVSEPVVATS
jgi:uncharacterized membrane protein